MAHSHARRRDRVVLRLRRRRARRGRAEVDPRDRSFDVGAQLRHNVRCVLRGIALAIKVEPQPLAKDRIQCGPSRTSTEPKSDGGQVVRQLFARPPPNCFVEATDVLFLDVQRIVHRDRQPDAASSVAAIEARKPPNADGGDQSEVECSEHEGRGSG